MKTEKNLYPYILDDKNVLQAIKDVVKNKKKTKKSNFLRYSVIL